MSRDPVRWLPTPDEIRTECLKIRAEKGDLPDQRFQRIDVRTLFDLGDDHDEGEDDDGD